MVNNKAYWNPNASSTIQPHPSSLYNSLGLQAAHFKSTIIILNSPNIIFLTFNHPSAGKYHPSISWTASYPATASISHIRITPPKSRKYCISQQKLHTYTYIYICISGVAFLRLPELNQIPVPELPEVWKEQAVRRGKTIYMDKHTRLYIHIYHK